MTLPTLRFDAERAEDGFDCPACDAWIPAHRRYCPDCELDTTELDTTPAGKLEATYTAAGLDALEPCQRAALERAASWCNADRATIESGREIWGSVTLALRRDDKHLADLIIDADGTITGGPLWGM